jgi:hypothetical protein
VSGQDGFFENRAGKFHPAPEAGREHIQSTLKILSASAESAFAGPDQAVMQVRCALEGDGRRPQEKLQALFRVNATDE